MAESNPLRGFPRLRRAAVSSAGEAGSWKAAKRGGDTAALTGMIEVLVLSLELRHTGCVSSRGGGEKTASFFWEMRWSLGGRSVCGAPGQADDTVLVLCVFVRG